MDMLGDTGQALRSYIHQCEGPVELGASYLLVFGALQVLYVQQDAAFWLCQALGAPRDVAQFRQPGKWISAAGNERLAEVRKLRNSSIGHPVNRDNAPEADRGSYFIVQMSLGPTGFQLMTRNDAGRGRRVNVPVLGLVESQVKVLNGVMRKALVDIGRAERSHKRGFSGEKFAATWDALNYPVEKMHEAVQDRELRSLGTYGVNAIRAAMGKCRDELQSRDEPFGEGLKLLYSQLDGALGRLTRLFDGGDEDEELAGMLVVFAADRIDELASRARELDDEYTVDQTKRDSAARARVARKRAIGEVPRR